MITALDNAKIQGLAASGAALAEFPFLSLQIEQRACCGRVTGHSPDFDNIRRSVAALPDDKKVRLKELMGVETLVVHYNDGTAVQTVQF
jgi:hypothetical protein